MQGTVFDKVVSVITPFLTYLCVSIFAQAIFTFYVMSTHIKNIGNNAGYSDSMNFMDNMNKIATENSLLVSFITIIILIPIYLIMYRKFRGNLRFVGKTKGMYFNVIVGILSSLGISKMMTILPIDGILGNYSELSKNIMDNNIPLQIITLIILGPFMEELLFRGLIYNNLKIFTDKTIAAYITSIIFGVYHFNLVQGLYTFVLGILLVYVFEKYETLIAPYLLHLSANAVAVFIKYFAVSRYIDERWYLKLVFMVIEIVALYMVLRFMRKEKSEIK